MLWVNQIATIESRSLTTFRTESMRIRAPKRSDDGNVFEEAFQLIKQHFIDRSKYTENDWKNLKREYGSIPDQHEAIRQFLKTFNDPYTTFYEPTTMCFKSETFRGERVTLGLSLGRRWDFKNLEQLRNDVKNSFSRFFSGDFSVISKRKLTLCRYAAASLMLLPEISSRMSNQLLHYTKHMSPRLARRLSLGAYGCMICADVVSKIIDVCCDIVVIDSTGGAFKSGIRVGDKVTGICYDNHDHSLRHDIKASQYKSMRRMRRVIENGPIDQYIYINVTRPCRTIISGVKEKSTTGPTRGDENEALVIKCARDYR